MNIRSQIPTLVSALAGRPKRPNDKSKTFMNKKIKVADLPKWLIPNLNFSEHDLYKSEYV